MSTMYYKGYVGSVEVSEEDNCLFGEVLALPKGTVILYEGQTVDELREDFHGAIDDYLTHCAEKGIEPRRSYSGTLNVRISPETHSRIASIAGRQGISINAFIKRTLDSAVAVL